MALTFSLELLGVSTLHDRHSESAFRFISLVGMVIIYVGIIYTIIDFVTPDEEVEEYSGSPASVMRIAASTGMSPAELKDQPCFIHGIDDASKSCAVCLDGFKSGNVCRIFPLCQHTFHAQCIDPWLLRSRSCPTCRSPFRASLDNV